VDRRQRLGRVVSGEAPADFAFQFVSEAACIFLAAQCPLSPCAGLGHQFLRHLQRTRLLLHMVDIAPFDEGVDPVAQAKAIVAELKKYDQALYDKPRWLVLNKLDMVPAEERAAKVKDFVKRFKWKGPVFEISALTREGCEPLIKAIYQHVHDLQQAEHGVVEVDPRFVDDAPQ